VPHGTEKTVARRILIDDCDRGDLSEHEVIFILSDPY